LPADASRAQTIAGRDPRLGTDRSHHGAIFCGESGGLAVKALRRFLKRLTSWTRREGDEARLRAEIEVHLAMQTAENVRAGLSPVEARRQAVLTFGAVEAIREEYRDQRGLPVLEH